MNILVGIGVYLIFTVVGFAWFFHRLGTEDPFAPRWWLKTLDTILILPLMPYFYLMGLNEKKRMRNLDFRKEDKE